MFDVPPPLQSEGIDAYRRTWDVFFRWMADPLVFNFSDLRVTAGTDVAFATAHGKCAGIEEDGTRSELDFRLTVGLRKSGGKWVIVHEHHSLPATS
jgi:ketosteroid isomerase-like protein